MYDLELECDDAGDSEDMDGDKDSGDSLNTSDDSYSVDNIKDNDNSGGGVKALSKRSHKETIKMMRESAKKQEPCDPNDPETEKLFDEIGDILCANKDIKNSNDEPGRSETPCFDVNMFTQDLDEYFEKDEGGELDIPIDKHATLSESMLTSEPF